MKRVIKLFLLFGILYSSLFASIDEYKSDLYYANGIMINISEKEATKIWNQKVKELFADKQDSYKNLEKIQNSYNRSQGFFDDLFEALEQKISNEFGWEQLSAYVTVFLTTHNIQEDWNAHIDDLAKQVTSYKQSIKDGHGVIVIAHSQGNYYTNEAYVKLDDWMKDYFHMFGIATPANHVAGFDMGDTTAPYVKFHNDFINIIVGGLASNRTDTRHHGFPSVDAHDFYESYMIEERTRQNILDFITSKIQEQVESQSQWATNEESDENTKDYRITVNHIYDANIIMDENVFPFAANKKLYQVKDTAGTPHYVKASFGGERILDGEVDNDLWEAEDNQFYKLEGTDPVEYIQANCKEEIVVLNSIEDFEIIGDINPQYDQSYGIWMDTVLNDANYLKYDIADEDKVTHFKCKLSGYYDTPPESLGSISLHIKYLDESSFQLAVISDAWHLSASGQVIYVNEILVAGDGTLNENDGYGVAQDFFNFPVEADVPVDRQENIDYIYIKGRLNLSGYSYSRHFIKDIELSVTSCSTED